MPKKKNAVRADGRVAVQVHLGRAAMIMMYSGLRRGKCGRPGWWGARIL